MRPRLLGLLLLLVGLLALPLAAQPQGEIPAAPDEGWPVRLDGEELFRVNRVGDRIQVGKVTGTWSR